MEASLPLVCLSFVKFVLCPALLYRSVDFYLVSLCLHAQEQKLKLGALFAMQERGDDVLDKVEKLISVSREGVLFEFSANTSAVGIP